MTLKLLIVDDEALARMRLRSLVDDLAATATAPADSPRWVVAGEAANAEQALSLLQQQPVHAVLLDIQLPGQDGLQLAAHLRKLPQPPAVVFVTAHEAHALRAFELEAVDYLAKPVRLERLRTALARVAQRLPAQPADAVATTEPLVISERGRVLRLPLSELLYFKADQKLVLLRTREGSHLIDDSLTDLEQRLADLGGRFIRVHRNALVALGAMRELQLRQEPAADAVDGVVDLNEGWAVRVAPLDEWLAVSRRQVAAVRAALIEGGA